MHQSITPILIHSSIHHIQTHRFITSITPKLIHQFINPSHPLYQIPSIQSSIYHIQTHPSSHQSITSKPIHPSINPSHPSDSNPSIHSSIHHIHQTQNTSNYLSIHPSTLPSVHPSIHSSICQWIKWINKCYQLTSLLVSSGKRPLV